MVFFFWSCVFEEFKGVIVFWLVEGGGEGVCMEVILILERSVMWV